MYKFGTRDYPIFLHPAAWSLTVMGHSIGGARSRGCGEGGHVTGLGQTGCSSVGVTRLEETVYGGMTI